MIDKNILDAQESHWETVFAKEQDKFGVTPSEAAVRALQKFRKHGKTRILELGAGQGRDTLFFAKNGLDVHVLDYTKKGTEAIKKKAEEAGLSDRITVIEHDIREPFPVSELEGCFSHMLYCMALTTEQLHNLNKEVRQVLLSGGLNIYTVRHTGDPEFGVGIHRGENMYEMNGFIVHFFSNELIDELTEGYRLQEKTDLEEGSLPKRLYQVTLEKL